MRVRSFWCLLALTLPLGLTSYAETVTDLEQLNAAVNTFLVDHFSQTGDMEIEISVKRLDPRLRLAQCNRELEFTVRDNGNPGGNVSVHTRCTGTTPWALYVPAQVKVLQAVVVASRNIPKGTVLSLEDFDTQIRDVAAFTGNYVVDAGQLIGKMATRTIRLGDALRFALVTEPIAIKRGDTVVVEARTGAVLVSSQAIALADGRIGEQISVRNTQSERIVRIEIMGPGRGRVIL